MCVVCLVVSDWAGTPGKAHPGNLTPGTRTLCPSIERGSREEGRLT